MEEILEIMEKDSRITPEEIAVMTGRDVQQVKDAISKMEQDGTILGYATVVNWEKTARESVTALIEVKVIPQRGQGFDKIAERIYRYPEVKSVYLVSGGFDLAVIIEGKTLNEVAYFVAEKLATLESVQGTATHFVLKKYKDKGVIFGEQEKDRREAIRP